MNLLKKFTKHSGVCFIVWCYSSMVCQAQAVIYPGPGTLKPSAEYSVKVDGRDAFVYASPVPAAYCSFDMSGPVEVIIKTAYSVEV